MNISENVLLNKLLTEVLINNDDSQRFCDISITILNGTKYSRMDQAKFFKGSLPQILLVTLLNTLTQMNMLHTKNRMLGEINALSNKKLIESFINKI